MKKMLTGLVIIFAFQSIAQTVTFKVKTIDLPDSVAVYIAGSQPEIGGWNPSLVPLEKNEDGFWIKTVEFNNVPGIEYKFTLGSWDFEAANSNGIPLTNSHFKIKDDTIVHHQIDYWTQGAVRINKGQITGEVKYHRNVIGENVLARDLIVWLPPNYKNDLQKSYPVIYMHDGQNIIDPTTSAFGTDWSIDETCDSLIRNNKIPPVIVVGIYNTTDRNMEYHPGKKGDNYMKFVVEKVKPIIDSNYRTKPEREFTITGGSSSGGIISFMLAWEYPHIFSKSICMSPAFKIANIDYVETVAGYNGKKKPLKFYIDNGGVGLELKLQPGVDDMLRLLKEKKFIEGKDFLWVLNEDAQHNEGAWATRFPKAIEWLLSN